jgi:hypothetical protein
MREEVESATWRPVTLLSHFHFAWAQLWKHLSQVFCQPNVYSTRLDPTWSNHDPTMIQPWSNHAPFTWHRIISDPCLNSSSIDFESIPGQHISSSAWPSKHLSGNMWQQPNHGNHYQHVKICKTLQTIHKPFTNHSQMTNVRHWWFTCEILWNATSTSW